MFEKFLEPGICPIILTENKKQKANKRYVSLLVSVTRLKNKNFCSKNTKVKMLNHKNHHTNNLKNGENG